VGLSYLTTCDVGQDIEKYPPETLVFQVFERVSWRWFNAFCPGFKPFCPILRPAEKPPSDCGTVGSGLILFISGLMLFVRRSKPFCPILNQLESHQVIVAQGFDAVGMIFAFIIQVSYPTLRVVV
jgi:hypothetical protein